MPNVTPAGSSPPPVSGRVEDPQLFIQAKTVRTFTNDVPGLGLPEQQSVSGLVVVEEPNHSPKRLNTGDEKTSGKVQPGSCDHPKKREEVIKEISISSTAFIGPACRPQPALEDELSEFYKELEQVDQPDTVDGNIDGVFQSWPPRDTVDRNVSRSWAPPHAVDGKSSNVSHSWAPQDAVDGQSQHKGHFWSPLNNPPSIKQNVNDHRNSYRPYPATRQQPHYRNSPQWRPQSYDTTCAWSNPPSLQNHWQHPPPNIHFYPPPRSGAPTPHPPYSQHHRHPCIQPENLQPALSHSPAFYNPNEAFERRHYEEQNYQKMWNDEPSFVLILMRGLPGSGKSTLARQISSRGPSGLILSTDDYFYQKDGYHFDPTLLGNAHDWNHNRAKKAMLEGRTPIIIDNTNVQAWEMKPYVSVALEMGYRVERNHHGVPKESIANMLDRFELPISVDVVMNSSEPSQKRKDHPFRPYRHR
ncbi:NEDD4-binding protein 2-like 2 [Bagarius yarrelli]|uniref:NEDD4-binding protein 2-like 2 n=1 Tax=Bagarius yarrelli TaxID=175774 RepID=A0A556TRS6_BAGYA|nr:NEDD4-binding protein 2-like 2 [Bagarius yarrelli]